MRKLCEFLDNQDAVALREFLIENQDLGLNNITASGCSALFYALTLKIGIKPSLTIIQELINTNRINPTETYNNLRYDAFSLPSDIIQVIKTYEDQYQRLAVTEQAQDNNPNRSANIAHDSQNTHDSIVVKGVGYSSFKTLKFNRMGKSYRTF